MRLSLRAICSHQGISKDVARHRMARRCSPVPGSSIRVGYTPIADIPTTAAPLSARTSATVRVTRSQAGCVASTAGPPSKVLHRQHEGQLGCAHASRQISLQPVWTRVSASDSQSGTTRSISRPSSAVIGVLTLAWPGRIVEMAERPLVTKARVDHFVAFTSCLFEPLPIENRHHSAVMLDHSCGLERGN
jgi:hypothetical protein